MLWNMPKFKHKLFLVICKSFKISKACLRASVKIISLFICIQASPENIQLLENGVSYKMFIYPKTFLCQPFLKQKTILNIINAIN